MPFNGRRSIRNATELPPGERSRLTYNLLSAFPVECDTGQHTPPLSNATMRGSPTFGPDMKRSQVGFTLIQAASMIAFMAIAVIFATPRFAARQLNVSRCVLPDFQRHVECFGTAGKSPNGVSKPP